VDAHELAAGELLLQLVDAVDRGLKAALLRHEPDVVAVRLRVLDLGAAQQDHAVPAHADETLRGRRTRLGRLAFDLVAVRHSEGDERADRLVAQEHGAQRDPARLGVELGHELRRTDPVAVEPGLLDRVAGIGPEVQARLPADRGIDRRDPRGHAQEEAGPFIGDHDPSACVQRGERLAGPCPRLGERRGQLGAGVAGPLA